MDYNDDCREFLDVFLTSVLREKYHIKSIEKTSVCFSGKGILAPYFEVYVRAILDNNQEEEIKELIISAYKKYYKTDISPGINILSSARFVRKYKGKYYHLCVAKDSYDRNFVDYEIFEILPEGYEAVLNKKYAMYQAEYDKKLVIRINFMDRSIVDVYTEIYRNGFSEKLLEMVLKDYEMKKTNEEWKNIVKKSRESVEKRYPKLSLSLDFGVYYSPENYFVSFIFWTNRELEDAKESGLTNQINEYFKICMQENGYPSEAIKDCDFASQEQCEKEYSGNWFYYYK